MRKNSSPFWRGFSVQLFAVTVLPLTLLLLVIAFGSVTMHQRDMRDLVGERDERAVQAASAALESELHHRMASISSLSTYAQSSEGLTFEEALATSNDLMSDFDGGVAFMDSKGILAMRSDQQELWVTIVENLDKLRLASKSEPGPVISTPFTHPSSRRSYIIVSSYSPSTAKRLVESFSIR